MVKRTQQPKRRVASNQQIMNRKQRRELARKIQSDDISLEVVHPDAAGIDIGNEAHYVAVPPQRDNESVRRFGCTTAELKAMAARLGGGVRPDFVDIRHNKRPAQETKDRNPRRP